MRCDLARMTMISAMDEPVPDARRRELATHLRECEGCRDEERRLARLSAALGALAREAEVPTGLEDEVVRRIRQPAEAGPSFAERLRAWLSPPALAAACAAALVLAVSLADRQAPPEVRPTPVAKAPARPEAAPSVIASASAPERHSPAASDEPLAVARADDRWASPEGPPPVEVESALPLLLDLPILRNMEKLEHYDTIVTTTLADEAEASG